MSSTTTNSSSGLSSAGKKFRNQFDNIFHKYPKLPKELKGDSLPLQIESKISAKSYNIFLDRIEKTGYKFHWDNGNVYIIDMADMEHEAVVAVLFKYFDKPNNGVIRGPIKVLGAPYHYNPIGSGNKIAPDVAICPSIAHVLNPLIDHQGPPSRNANNRPHARIVCEVGNTQTIVQWNTKCELWMHEEYVRCVLGIKLFPKTIMGTTVHRAMIARLWTRVASAGGVLSQNATLARAGVYVMEWDFGTIHYNSTIPTPTDCNALNLNAFQVTITIADVFYDPPIIEGVPTPYAVFVPGTVVGVNFVIDLFKIQQEVLDSQ